jgi:hypothetical protein
MATNTLDPRKSFTSTRFKTSRFPGFMSQTLDATGNVEEEPQPAAIESPLRGVGLGLSTESDGPSPENVGPGSKSYTDMTDEELSQEEKNRSFARDVFGVGMPEETVEGYGKKGIGLAANMALPGIGPMVNLANKVGKEDFDKAIAARDKRALERAAGIAGGSNEPSDPTAMGAIGSHPDDYGLGTGTPGGAGYDPNRGPEASPSQPEGDLSEETAQAEGAIGSHPDDYGGGDSGGGPSESDPGPGGSTGSQDTSAGSGMGDSTYRMGGPIPNKGSPEIEPVRITAHETEHVMNPEATAYWGNDMLEAMSAIAEGVATPEQVQLVRQMINKGSAAAMPQSRPNPMQAMGSPLRSAGTGMAGG